MNKETINFFIDLFQDIIISGIVVFYLKRMIEQKFVKQEQIDQYFSLVMNDLRKLISTLKQNMLSVHLMEGDTEQKLKKVYISGGDLQCFIEENIEYFEYVNKKRKKDVFQIETLNYLIKNMTKMGNAMTNDKYTEFGNTFNENIKVCTELLKKYNLIIINY